jgi:hypothetical protein
MRTDNGSSKPKDRQQQILLFFLDFGSPRAILQPVRWFSRNIRHCSAYSLIPPQVISQLSGKVPRKLDARSVYPTSDWQHTASFCSTTIAIYGLACAIFWFIMLTPDLCNVIPTQPENSECFLSCLPAPLCYSTYQCYVLFR